MTGSLFLHGPAVTLDLLNPAGAGLYLVQQGWSPAVGRMRADGTYGEMVEQIDLNWHTDNDADRAETLHALQRMAFEAGRDARNPIWIEAQTWTEALPRYAVVSAIEIPQLDWRHWRGPSPSRLRLVVTHGLWRDVPPVDSPDIVVTGPVYNRHVGAQRNWLDIPAQAGDAPALLKVSVRPFREVASFQIPNEVTISAGNAIVPNPLHFNAVDEMSQPKTADSEAPGGQRIVSTGPIDDDARWSVSDIYPFAERYSVFAVLHATGAGIRARFLWHDREGEWYQVPGDMTWRRHWLGDFVPSHLNIPDPVTPLSYMIGMGWSIPGGGTLRIRNLYLIPAQRAFHIHTQSQLGASGNQSQTISVADGVSGRCWNIFASNGELDSGSSPRWHGRFLELEPGRVTRLWFNLGWHTANNSITDGVDAFTGANVTVAAIRQFTALRG